MFDPEDYRKLGQLDTSVNWSIQRMSPFRRKRKDHIEQMCGKHYGDGGAPDNVPINTIDLGVSILQRFLASHAPQAMITSPYPDLSAAAADLELAVNFEADRINLGDAFNTWTYEALFRLGMLQVGIDEDGRIVVDPILLDRLIIDMQVGDWNELGYIGHDYQRPFEWVKENTDFDKSARDALSAPDDRSTSKDDEASEEIQLGGATSGEPFQPMKWLRQLFFPQEKIVCIFAVDQQVKKPLKWFAWDGPDRRLGPYHKFGLGKVPGNLMPNPPVPQWVDLHDQTNSLWNKSADQADRQKTILLVQGAAAADGQRIVSANDGEAIYSEDPKNCVEVSFGGANEKTFAMALQSKQLWDWRAGNMSALGGLAAQTRTLGQDRLLAESAGGIPEDYQQNLMVEQRGVFESISFWMLNDPTSEYHLIKRLDGAPPGMPGLAYTWTPEDRQGLAGDPSKYNIKINPHSGLMRSPAEQGNEFLTLVTQLLMPAQESMGQQGMGMDWEYIVKTVAKLKHSPEFARAVRYIEGEAMPDRGPVEKSSKPASTERRYVRENRPAATQQGQDQVLVKALMGGLASQPSEQASLLRTAS